MQCFISLQINHTRLTCNHIHYEIINKHVKLLYLYKGPTDDQPLWFKQGNGFHFQQNKHFSLREMFLPESQESARSELHCGCVLLVPLHSVSYKLDRSAQAGGAGCV